MKRLSVFGQVALSIYRAYGRSATYTAEDDQKILIRACDCARDFLSVAGMVEEDNLDAALSDLVNELGQAEGNRRAEVLGAAVAKSTNKPAKVPLFQCEGSQKGCSWGERCYHYTPHEAIFACSMSTGCQKMNGIENSLCCSIAEGGR